MITCTRKLQWCSGHRIMGHENKCSMLHGHNYRVEITAVSNIGLIPTNYKGNLGTGQDELGRVVDFSVLKKVYDPWIQEYWDHGFILHERDMWGISRVSGKVDNGSPQKLYLLPYNPTAENIAHFLLTESMFVQALALHYVKACRVVVHETDNCFAEASL